MTADDPNWFLLAGVVKHVFMSFVCFSQLAIAVSVKLQRSNWFFCTGF
jgi:hypothetical protein